MHTRYFPSSLPLNTKNTTMHHHHVLSDRVLVLSNNHDIHAHNTLSMLLLKTTLLYFVNALIKASSQPGLQQIPIQQRSQKTQLPNQQQKHTALPTHTHPYTHRTNQSPTNNAVQDRNLNRPRGNPDVTPSPSRTRRPAGHQCAHHRHPANQASDRYFPGHQAL